MTAPATTRTTPAVLASTLAFTVLTVAYSAVNAGVPHPDASGPAVLAYDTSHTGLLQWGALLMLCAAVPLVVASTIGYRAMRLRLENLPAVVVAGGLLAAGALTASAVFAWAGSRLTAAASPELARVVADLGFLTGGPAYAVGFGLFAAGIAVPALLGRLIPRPLAWLGLIVAAAGALSVVGLLVPGFLFLLPLVRFGGLLWLVVTAVVLSRR